MSNGAPTSPSAASPSAPKPPPSADSRDRLLRVTTFLVVLGAVAVILWSFFGVLSPRLKQEQALSAAVTRLSAEVDKTESQWSEAAIRQITNRFSQVSSNIFDGRASLEARLAKLNEAAVPLGLDLRADLGTPGSQTAGGCTLTIIPTTLSVEFQQSGPVTLTLTPYQRVLRLIELLTDEDKRADLTELTVMGGTNSVSRAVVVLNYWTEKEVVP